MATDWCFYGKQVSGSLRYCSRGTGYYISIGQFKQHCLEEHVTVKIPLRKAAAFYPFRIIEVKVSQSKSCSIGFGFQFQNPLHIG